MIIIIHLLADKPKDLVILLNNKLKLVIYNYL